MVASFQDTSTLYMLLDYCPGGEVFSYLRRARRFNEPTSQFYAAEILLILEFLHDKQGVAYRDLKPENILIDAEGHLKLVDFGFAKKVDNQETYTLCGTPEYLAPEVIRNTGRSFHGQDNLSVESNTYRSWSGRGLVGFWYPDLRVSRRTASFLGPKPYEDLRADC